MSAAAAVRPKHPKSETNRPRAGKTARQTAARHAHRESSLSPSTKYGGPMRYPADNWFACPADLLVLIRDKSANRAQDQILLYIGLRTWGTAGLRQPVVSARITIDDFVRELMLSPRMVEMMLADALKRGLITVKKMGNQRQYQLAPQNWKTAPDYVAAGDDAAGDDAAGDDAAGDDAAGDYSSQRMVASAAKRCKAVPFHVAVRGAAEPVKLRMECAVVDPTLDAIEVNATSRGGGLIRLEFSRAGLSPSGEGQANEPRSAVRGKTVHHSPAPGAESYSKLLKTELLTRFHHPYDAAFLADVLRRVNGAPFETYQAKLSDRIERARKSAPIHAKPAIDHRILLWVADDVGRLMTQRAEIEREHAAAAKVKAAARQADDAIAATAPMDAGLKASCRAQALADPAEWELFLATRIALGETDWPTLAELGVSRG